LSEIAGQRLRASRSAFFASTGAVLPGPRSRRTDASAVRTFEEFRRIRLEALAFLDDGKAGMAVRFLERAVEMNPEFSRCSRCSPTPI